MTSKTKHAHNWRFNAIGTSWQIETADVIARDVRKKIEDTIEEFDSIYSRFRDNSLVSMIASKPGTYELGEDSEKLAKLYKQLYEATDGRMTPWVGESLSSAGYDNDYSLVPAEPVVAPAWDESLIWSGKQIRTKKPAVLDIGAAGKGMLIDKIAQVLEENGLNQYVVDGSGDIRYRGEIEQRIGLENPYDASAVIGMAIIKDASICASAINRRRWANGWHHVLDGHTGRPVNGVVATWVVATDTAIADGLATALFFVKANRLVDIADFQYVRLLANGKIEYSKNFVGQLYI